MNQTYFLYNDEGGEVEVGWFRKWLDDLRRFWNVCKETDWRHYFQSNGRGEVVLKEFSGFRKFQNYQEVEGHWTICVKGGIRPPLGNSYYRSITCREIAECVDGNWSEWIKAKVAQAEERIDLYVAPDCTCRLGYHRFCPHHFRTKN